jgi:hypothetical protein
MDVHLIEEITQMAHEMRWVAVHQEMFEKYTWYTHYIRYLDDLWIHRNYYTEMLDELRDFESTHTTSPDFFIRYPRAL